MLRFPGVNVGDAYLLGSRFCPGPVDTPVKGDPATQRMGLTHLAIAVGSEQNVDQLTNRLRRDVHPVLDGPRRTGDGYYESVVLDPDGNRVDPFEGQPPFRYACP